MKKIIIIIVIILAAVYNPQSAYAKEIISEASAQTANKISAVKDYALDTRVRALKNILKKYNSPLAGQAASYVKYADLYSVDWKLLPSIAGLESTFGKFLMPESHNAYGWGGGHIYFDSWEDGIRVINKALRDNYINRGATDVWSIGPIYAESPTWAVRVNSFMNEINEEYLKLSTLSLLQNI